MALRSLFASVLLCLLLLSFVSESFESASSDGRSLLQKKKGKGKDREARAEAKREAEALEAYAKEQRKRDKERQAIITNAQEEAEEELDNFNKASDEEEQIDVFVKLWRNAKGPTILALLSSLVSSSEDAAPFYIQVVAESMLEADERGFSFQISDGLWAALTLVENPRDGGPLLDAILFNSAIMDEAEKGSGCDYIRNLLTDAEVLAIENGYETEFTQSFDNPEHLDIAECFYEACYGKALDCCTGDDAMVSGRCGCLKKHPDVCDFNLFLNTPRPIWRCNGAACSANKCLCPTIEDIEKSRKKGKGKSKKGKSKKRRSQKN